MIGRISPGKKREQTARLEYKDKILEIFVKKPSIYI